MSKYFVCSDIHGYYTEWMRALKDAGYDKKNKDHIIIICGDILDRGKEPDKIIKFILSLPKRRCLLVRGNHEDLFEEMINRGCPYGHDFSNGTVDTMKRLTNLEVVTFVDYPEAAKTKLKEIGLYKVFNRMKDYIEIGDKIFVHGWIPVEHVWEPEGIIPKPLEDWRTPDQREWKSARWLNGMEMASKGCTLEGKTIFCGHWHCSYGNVRKKYPNRTKVEYDKLCWQEVEFVGKDIFEPFVDEGIVALDACTAHTGFVNVYTFEE